MPLVTTNEMLKKAQAGHYAVGAFNVENMEMVMAVIKAAEEITVKVKIVGEDETYRNAFQVPLVKIEMQWKVLTNDRL